jgi:hypothetical protein
MISVRIVENQRKISLYTTKIQTVNFTPLKILKLLRIKQNIIMIKILFYRFNIHIFFFK